MIVSRHGARDGAPASPDAALSRCQSLARACRALDYVVKLATGFTLGYDAPSLAVIVSRAVPAADNALICGMIACAGVLFALMVSRAVLSVLLERSLFEVYVEIMAEAGRLLPAEGETSAQRGCGDAGVDE